MEKLRIRSAQYSLGGGTPAFFALAAAAAADAELPVTCLGLPPSAAVDMCNLVEEVANLWLLGVVADGPHAAAVGNCRRRSVAVVKTETARNRKFLLFDTIVVLGRTIEMQQDDLPTVSVEETYGSSIDKR
jgi:hypothetical protein